jgi:hypothetical protein
MKAQFIYENINFERNIDPLKAMNIGKYSLIERGELFLKLVKDYIDPYQNSWESTIDTFYMDDHSIRFNIGHWPPPYLNIFNKFLKEAKLYQYLEKPWDSRSKWDGARIEYLIKPEFKHFFKNAKLYKSKLHESQNFERNINPLDAMSAGKVLQRKTKQFVEKLDQLAINWGFYKVPYTKQDIEIVVKASADDTSDIIIQKWINSKNEYIILESEETGFFWIMYTSQSSKINPIVAYAEDFIDEGEWYRNFGNPIKESQNFERNIDPLDAMNIGINSTKTFTNYNDAAQFIILHITRILNEPKIPEDIIAYPEGWFFEDYYDKFYDYIENHFNFNINDCNRYTSAIHDHIQETLNIVHAHFLKKGYKKE